MHSWLGRMPCQKENPGSMTNMVGVTLWCMACSVGEKECSRFPSSCTFSSIKNSIRLCCSFNLNLGILAQYRSHY